MGKMCLGALLGADDGSMSFDVGSFAAWTIVPTSTAFLATEVHSSKQGATLSVASYALNNSLGTYAFGYALASQRWSPDVSTHTIRALAWARAYLAAESGQWNASLSALNGAGATITNSKSIAFNAALQRLELSLAAVNSDAFSPIFRIGRNAQTVGRTIAIDDVLVIADEQILQAPYDTNFGEELMAGRHRTADGYHGSIVWGGFRNFDVPLVHVPSSLADLYNYWWRRRTPLLLTLDTSDANTSYPVRIVSQAQPFGQRSRPDLRQYDGLLSMRTIRGGQSIF